MHATETVGLNYTKQSLTSSATHFITSLTYTWRHDTQHYDIQHKDTENNDIEYNDTLHNI
jgi:hypothetical protein